MDVILIPVLLQISIRRLPSLILIQNTISAGSQGQKQYQVLTHKPSDKSSFYSWRNDHHYPAAKLQSLLIISL